VQNVVNRHPNEPLHAIGATGSDTGQLVIGAPPIPDMPPLPAPPVGMPASPAPGVPANKRLPHPAPDTRAATMSDHVTARQSRTPGSQSKTRTILIRHYSWIKTLERPSGA
jgi:hypothetical protein